MSLQVEKLEGSLAKLTIEVSAEELEGASSYLMLLLMPCSCSSSTFDTSLGFIFIVQVFYSFLLIASLSPLSVPARSRQTVLNQFQ